MQRDSNAPHHQDTKLTPDSGCVFPTAPAIAGMHDILAAGPATYAASPAPAGASSPLSFAQKPILLLARMTSFSPQGNSAQMAPHSPAEAGGPSAGAGCADGREDSSVSKARSDSKAQKSPSEEKTPTAKTSGAAGDGKRRATGKKDTFSGLTQREATLIRHNPWYVCTCNEMVLRARPELHPREGQGPHAAQGCSPCAPVLGARARAGLRRCSKCHVYVCMCALQVGTDPSADAKNV